MYLSNKKTIISSLCALLVASFFSTLNAQEKETTAADKIDTYIGPRIFEKPLPPVYPFEMQKGNREGWVEVSHMVDSEGQPFEVEVLATSYGGGGFIESAVEALNNTKFKPALLNETPVEASRRTRYRFVMDNSPGVSPTFQKTYQFFQRSIDDNNQKSSKKYLDKLKEYESMSLADDAFLNIAEYQYQVLFGTEEAQLQYLTRAVGSSQQSTFFSNKPYYLFELSNLIRLQIKFNYLEEALDTYSIITKINDDSAFELLSRLEPYIDQLEDIKTNDVSYQTKANINQNGIWHIGLLKPGFTIVDLEGQIQEVKLRCARKYVFFEYIKDKVYHIPKSYGGCHAVVIGDPDTSFSFAQLASSK